LPAAAAANSLRIQTLKPFVGWTEEGFADRPTNRKGPDSHSDIIFGYPDIFQISDTNSDNLFGYRIRIQDGYYPSDIRYLVG
jgi:hypothetical protein